MDCNRIILAALVLVTISCAGAAVRAPSGAAAPSAEESLYLSPCALAATAGGRTLFIACATAGQVALFDTASSRVNKVVPVPDAPSGLALSVDGRHRYVTRTAPESSVCILDVAAAGVIGRNAAGHTAMAPVLSPDGRTLSVCNRFNNDVAFIDFTSRQEIRRVNVLREPVAAVISPDGKFLLVANHLHAGRADVDGQIDLTMQVVRAILVSREMDNPDVTRATAYLRNPADAPLFHKWRAKLGLEKWPLVTTQAVNCRDELLFEIEVDAMAPIVSSAAPAWEI